MMCVSGPSLSLDSRMLNVVYSRMYNTNYNFKLSLRCYNSLSPLVTTICGTKYVSTRSDSTTMHNKCISTYSCERHRHHREEQNIVEHLMARIASGPRVMAKKRAPKQGTRTNLVRLPPILRATTMTKRRPWRCPASYNRHNYGSSRPAQ